MKQKIQVLIALIFFFPVLVHAQSLESRLDALLDSVYQANQDALGILIHVASPEKELSWTRAVGFSDSSRNISLEKNQPVLIASNTKSYVSAAVLRLVEEGLIKIDGPIRDLLKPNTRILLKQDGYKLKKITVRHLLSHSSGIHDYVDDDYFDWVIQRPQYSWSRDEQIKRAVEIGEPLAKPGASFSYADVNYLLLTEIIENQTQEDFYTAMRRLLKYDELDLKHSWFKDLEPSPKDLPPFAHQYANAYTWDSYQLNHSWDLYGGGGMASTVKDAALFYQYLFEGRIIQNKDILKEMYSYVLPPQESKYCLGLFHFDFGYHLYYHGGWWGTGVNYSPQTHTSIAVFTLVREKRDVINPFLGKVIHDVIRNE